MPVPDDLPTRPEPSGRIVRIPWRRAVSVLVAGALVATATVLVLRREPSTAPVARVTAGPVRTATVERTDLTTTVNLPGQLGFGSEKPIRGDGDGAVTWLPAAGRTITRGRPVFRVDDRPVALFYGRTPLFRRLETAGTVGRDVRVVADNLAALGYRIGVQPPVGSMVSTVPAPAPTPRPGETPEGDTAEPAGTPPPSAPAVQVRYGDAVLTPALIEAVRRWQGDTGALRTGVIDVGQVVVRPGKIRVASVTAQLGDPADGPLISATGTAKQVTVQAEPAEMESVRGAREVTVTLPDGKAAAARITNISRVVTTGADGDAGGDRPQLTASVTLRRPSLVRNLDAAPVQVEFVSEARASVLAVPVGALLALSGGGYAVQIPGGGLIPVRTGLFARGQVEITGDGVAEGTKVVTTS